MCSEQSSKDFNQRKTNKLVFCAIAKSDEKFVSSLFGFFVSSFCCFDVVVVVVN